MKTSVIIPTLNAGRSIGKLLSMLLSQDFESPEIIIIDSSSDDDTISIAQNFGTKTMVIPRQTFNHGKTRNIAALEAQGDIIVFMTQDALPANNALLHKLTAPLKKPEIAATFGKHIPKSDAPPLEAFARYFNYPDQGSVKGIDDVKKYGIKTFFFSNVCSSMKKESFLKVGMFPEDVRANEDMLIAAKFILNRYEIAYVPEAMVIHSHNYSLLKLFRRYYNIGSSIKDNKSILEDIEAEEEGIRFVKEQIRYVVKQRKYFWLPRIFLESLSKYAGYRAGLIAG
jgi:rhamnosyltransferase